MTTAARDRAACLAVVVLVLVALGLRLPGLATRSLWLDEAWRANLAVAPSWQAFWAEVLGAGAGGIGAPLPPLFALLLRAVALVVGRSTAGLRALPLAASVAAVPLGYLVARRVRGRAAGVAAAFCFACYPAVVFHGQELKQYSVDVLCVLVLLWLVARTVEEPEKRARWALVAAAMALAPGFSYPAALVVPGLALGLLVACRTRQARVLWAAAHAVAAVAALAWYVAVIGPQRARPLTTAYWAASFAPRGSELLLPWALAQLRAVVDYVLGRPLWLVVPALLVGYLSTPRWVRVAALVTVAVVIAAAALEVYPLAGGRTSLFLAPLLYVPLAAAVAWVASLGATASPGAPKPSSARAPTGAGRRVLGGLALIAAVGLAAFPARGSLRARAGLVVEETAPLVAWLAAERRAGRPCLRLLRRGAGISLLSSGARRADHARRLASRRRHGVREGAHAVARTRRARVAPLRARVPDARRAVGARRVARDDAPLRSRARGASDRRGVAPPLRGHARAGERAPSAAPPRGPPRPRAHARAARTLIAGSFGLLPERRGRCNKKDARLVAESSSGGPP